MNILDKLWQEKNRITPLTGTEAFRQRMIDDGKFKAHELHTTSQDRIFCFNGTDDVFLGPAVQHEEVADEATMLSLDADSPRGCWPGDTVRRTDQDTRFTCISNHGELITDWEAEAASSDTDIDGGNFTETITASELDVDGGTFV